MQSPTQYFIRVQLDDESPRVVPHDLSLHKEGVSPLLGSVRVLVVAENQDARGVSELGDSFRLVPLELEIHLSSLLVQA